MTKQFFSFLFSLGTAYFTFFALLLGNVVVATNSGDACGNSWPQCNGYWLPDFSDYRTIIEYSHRIFTTVLGFVILINAILVFLNRKKTHEVSTRLALLSILLLLVQSMIGGLNVKLGTPIGFTTLDVIFSLSLLVCLVFLSVSLYEPLQRARVRNISSANKIRKNAIVLFLCFYANIAIGAFFKHSRASKTLLNLPTDGSLFSGPSIPELLYFIHGIASIVLVLGTVFLYLSLRKSELKSVSLALLLFIIIDTLSGAASYISKLKPLISSLHMALSTVSLGLLCVVLAYFLLIYRKDSMSYLEQGLYIGEKKQGS